MGKILYIVNPAALGGRGIEIWGKFQAQWPELVNQQDIFLTERTKPAREIAYSCQGYEILVAVGGDGTVNEVLSGIMDRSILRPGLAVIPAGTGNDIASNLGIFSLEEAALSLQQRQARWFDLIRIDCHKDGLSLHRYAFLSCNVGFAAISLKMLKPWMKRWLGAKAAYFLSSFLGVIFYRSPWMQVRWQAQTYSGRTWTIFVGNAEWAAGGSMRVAPGACINDGKLDVTIAPAKFKAVLPLKMLGITSGAHINQPHILYFPVEEITVESHPAAGLAIDGDIFGATPAKFSVCPRAIQIICSKSAKWMQA